MFSKLQHRIQEESFQPTMLSLVANPGYICRRGLFLAVKEFSSLISGNVLDFGCGSKPYASLFSGAINYVGVDVKTSGHDHKDSKVDVFYDGRTLPFCDGQFDAVVSFEVFEHVFNLPEILLEIRRVIKDSGYLLVSLPFAWYEHETPYDYARYTSFGITHLLRSSGFEIAETRKTSTFLSAVGQIFVGYLTQLNPRSKMLRHIFQFFVIFPITAIFLTMNALLPKSYSYFTNVVVLARKCTSPSHDALNLEPCDA